MSFKFNKESQKLAKIALAKYNIIANILPNTKVR